MSKIYRVTIPGDPGTASTLLIRANTKAGAIAHAARGLITATVATQDDLLGVDPASVQTAPAKRQAATTEAPDPRQQQLPVSE